LFPDNAGNASGSRRRAPRCQARDAAGSFQPMAPSLSGVEPAFYLSQPIRMYCTSLFLVCQRPTQRGPRDGAEQKGNSAILPQLAIRAGSGSFQRNATMAKRKKESTASIKEKNLIGSGQRPTCNSCSHVIFLPGNGQTDPIDRSSSLHDPQVHIVHGDDEAFLSIRKAELIEQVNGLSTIMMES